MCVRVCVVVVVVSHLQHGYTGYQGLVLSRHLLLIGDAHLQFL